MFVNPFISGLFFKAFGKVELIFAVYAGDVGVFQHGWEFLLSEYAPWISAFYKGCHVSGSRLYKPFGRYGPNVGYFLVAQAAITT